MKLKITRLYDEHDCETCGPSYADGYRATVNGEFLCEFVPFAHCYDGRSVTEQEMYGQILTALGYEVENEEAV